MHVASLYTIDITTEKLNIQNLKSLQCPVPSPIPSKKLMAQNSLKRKYPMRKDRPSKQPWVCT
jgi:hypothetical protein